MSSEILPKDFYGRDPGIVAKELLGRRLVRRLDDVFLEGLIVETEAYLGLNDPASRAYQGLKHYNRLMWDEVGRAFIYNVHKYWMFNIVAHTDDGVGAVLIRALEPVRGIETMKKNRLVMNVFELTSGPGKLTIALNIDRRLNGTSVTSRESRVNILDNIMNLEIGCSHRIGVKKDLARKLRFYIKGNKFVSG